MFQDLNPLDKPTAILEIVIMLAVAAILGFLIGYIIQTLQKDKLKAELRFSADKYNTLNKRYEDKIAEYRETENIISDLRNRKSNLIVELDNLKIENDDLKKEIKNLINNKSNDADVKTLNAYIARLKKDKEDLKTKLEETETAADNTTEITALKQEIEKLSSSNTILQEEITQLNKSKSDKSEVDTLNAYIARLKKDKEDLKAKLEESETAADNTTEITALKKEIDKLSSYNSALQDEINELNESKSDNVDVNALNAYIARLKKDKEDLKSKLSNAEDSNNANEIETLNKTIDKLTISNEALQEELKKANENIKSAEENKTVLATNIETSSSKPEVKTNKEVKTLSLEAFKIKKLALFQSIGEASESNKDNLVEINGIGPLIEAKLNTIGIYSYKQIASFTDKDIANVTDLIEFFPGRIERDEWVKQAKELMNVEA